MRCLRAFLGIVFVLSLVVYFSKSVAAYWKCSGSFTYQKPRCVWVPPPYQGATGHYTCGSTTQTTQCGLVNYGGGTYACQGSGWTQYSANCQLSNNDQSCQVIGGYDHTIDCGGPTWVEVPTPTPPGYTPTPTQPPSSCTEHCSGNICAPGGSNPPDSCGCGGCSNITHPPKLRPSALVFLDLNGNGDYEPNLGERIITDPNAQTNYRVAGAPDRVVSCGSAVGEITPLAGFAITSTSGDLSPTCYSTNPGGQYNWTTNDSPFSTCGDNHFGSEKTWPDVNTCNQKVACDKHCNDCGATCGSGVDTVGDLLGNIPGNWMDKLDNQGSVWINVYADTNETLTMTQKAPGYEITSTRGYQWINQPNVGWTLEENVKCKPNSGDPNIPDCSLTDSANVGFVDAYTAGGNDAFNPGEHYYVLALWGVKVSDKYCSIDAPANFVAGQPSTVNLSGESYNGSPDVLRFFVEKQDTTQLATYGQISPAATQTYSAATGYYYYNIASQSQSLGAGPVASAFSLTLPGGLYYLHCDIPQNPGKCSGNPFCDYKGGPLTCTADGWRDCVGTTELPVCSEGGPYWSICTQPRFQRTGTYDCIAPTTEACLGTITGTFFDASDLPNCPATIPDNLKIDGGLLTAVGAFNGQTYQGSVGANGVYSIGNVQIPDNYPLTATPPTAYVASPKFSCQGPSANLTTQGESQTHNFGFWKVYGGWYQALGGGVYGGTGITVNIPGTMSDNLRHLIVADVNGQDGLAYHKSGSVVLGTYPGLTVSPSGLNATSGFSGDVQDYAYWLGKMGVYDKTPWDGSNTINYNGGANGYQILTFSGDLNNFNIGTVNGNKKIILLIDGNVRVTGNVLVQKVAGQENFLSVIASGSITFAPNVTQAEGFWIGNSLSFPSAGVKSDFQFVGRGSFVGWNGVTLSRDLTGTNNNLMPAEQFVFRPDLLINAPEPMKVSQTTFKLETPN